MASKRFTNSQLKTQVMYTNILEQLEKAIALKERGLFIYTLTNFESWATIDVDFLLHGL